MLIELSREKLLRSSLPDLQAGSPVARSTEYNPAISDMRLSAKEYNPVARGMEYNLVAKLVVTLTALVPWLCYGTNILVAEYNTATSELSATEQEPRSQINRKVQ